MGEYYVLCSTMHLSMQSPPPPHLGKGGDLQLRGGKDAPLGPKISYNPLPFPFGTGAIDLAEFENNVKLFYNI